MLDFISMWIEDWRDQGDVSLEWGDEVLECRAHGGSFLIGMGKRVCHMGKRGTRTVGRRTTDPPEDKVPGLTAGRR